MGIWKKIPLNRGEPFPLQQHHPKEEKSVGAKKPFPLLGINFFFSPKLSISHFTLKWQCHEE